MRAKIKHGVYSSLVKKIEYYVVKYCGFFVTKKNRLWLLTIQMSKLKSIRVSTPENCKVWDSE
jgi:hypothetical protein